MECPPVTMPISDAEAGWWSLSPDELYLWRYLPLHMHGALLTGEASAEMFWLDVGFAATIFCSTAAAESHLCCPANARAKPVSASI